MRINKPIDGGLAGGAAPRPVCWTKIDYVRRLKTRDIAARLGVTSETVCKMVRRGDLPKPVQINGRLTFDRFQAERAIAKMLAARAKTRARRGRITTRRVAEILSVTPLKVRTMAAAGELPAPTKLKNRLLFDRQKIDQLRLRRRRAKELAP